jgi:hypothetical protein
MRHRLTSGETAMMASPRGIAREPGLASTGAFG